MFRLIPVELAALALTGCMKSYPLWDPPPPQSAEETMPASVTLEGRVASIDEDDESIELEIDGEDSEESLRVEFGSSTEVYPAGARDRAVRGNEGLEMLAEDDQVVVTEMKADEDVIRAREVSIGARGPAPKAKALADSTAATCGWNLGGTYQGDTAGRCHQSRAGQSVSALQV